MNGSLLEDIVKHFVDHLVASGQAFVLDRLLSGKGALAEGLIHSFVHFPVVLSEGKATYGSSTWGL